MKGSHFLKNNLCLFVFLFVLICVLIPVGARGAVLYLEPSQGQYYQGDTFIVNARIDTEDECINTVEANLSFSQDVLEVVDFSKGNSILTIWLKSPVINQESGLISFVGGIPGGFCGPIPGDPGKSDLLGKIIFKVTAKTPGVSLSTPGVGVVEFLDSSQVLLNDGFGTPAKLKTKGAIFTILPGIPEVPKKEWQAELEKDTIPPEPFEIEIHQDPAIFDGKYFIVFQTQDKQTGIDYYEVKEGKKDWQRAESPYLLKDQRLKNIIKVRAVDKAGNERIAEYLPTKRPFPWWIIILVLVVAGAIWWIIKRKKIESRI